MSLLETLKNLVDKDRQAFPSRPIDPTHVDHAFSTEPLTAGRDYFRLWLSQMFLRKQVVAFQEWYPAVHSFVRFQFGSQTVDVPNLADPTKALQMEQTPKGDIIFRRKALTPLMPFNGGTVELSAGLVGLKGSRNPLEQFVNVIGDVAGLLAVPQLSTALAVVKPLTNGIQALFSAGQAGLHLGWYDTFVGVGGQVANELKAGYLAIARAPEGQAVPAKLWVVDDLLYEGTAIDADKRHLLEGLDFMLFRIEVRAQRDDYDQLTSIFGPFNKALEQLDLGAAETAESFYRAALVAVQTSPDLTKADRIRMREQLKAQYAEAKGGGGDRGLVAAEPPSLQRLMDSAMPPDQALAGGEPSMEELLGQ
jgi:hypothetical protein